MPLKKKKEQSFFGGRDTRPYDKSPFDPFSTVDIPRDTKQTKEDETFKIARETQENRKKISAKTGKVFPDPLITPVPRPRPFANPRSGAANAPRVKKYLLQDYFVGRKV